MKIICILKILIFLENLGFWKVLSSRVEFVFSCALSADIFPTMPIHMLPAYGEKANRWEFVSSLDLHKGQKPGPSKPHFCNISHVSSLLDRDNHILIMVFKGLCICQILFHHHCFSPPSFSSKYSWYPSLAVYFPDLGFRVYFLYGDFLVHP